jgi:hypothetical protein
MRFFNNQKIKKGILIPLIFWLMIWAGYNTSPQKLDFSNLLNFFHGIRAFFPILAGFLAMILLIKRDFFSLKIFKTPLGLLIIYTFIGIISSIFLSAKPFLVLYWAFSYFSVLAVLFLTLTDSNSIPSLINLNWIIVFIITIGLFLFFLLQPGVIPFLVSGNSWGRPYQDLAGVPAEKEILGMVGTRPTGFGRYAGVVAIFALARTILTKERKKFLWYFLFLIFFFLLYFSKARMAIFGFILGSYIIFLLKSRSKIAIFGWSFFTIVHLVLAVTFLFYIPYLSERIILSRPTITTPVPEISSQAPSVPIPKPSQTKKNFITLGGRTTGIWPQAWKLFLKSPLIGWGFHADRIFLKGQGQHAHNALLHALIQTGIIGTIPFAIAFILSWIILFKLLKNPSLTERPFLIEIAGVMAFFMIRGITESTGAFFGVDWLLLASLIAYLQQLNQKRLD